MDITLTESTFLPFIHGVWKLVSDKDMNDPSLIDSSTYEDNHEPIGNV